MPIVFIPIHVRILSWTHLRFGDYQEGSHILKTDNKDISHILLLKSYDILLVDNSSYEFRPPGCNPL